MHECLSARDWIKLWSDPERDTHRLADCPVCWPLRGEREAWAASVADCEHCRTVLDAPPLDNPDVLDCPRCMEAFARLHELLDELEHFEPSVAPEALVADELFGRLVKLSPSAQIARVTDDLRYQQWGLAQALLRSARKLWCSDPETAHNRAKVGAAVADLLDPDTYHVAWAADLQAKAYAYLGNCLRILGEFREADRAFATAERHLRQGVGSGQRRALVSSIMAALRIDQQRYVEAEALTDAVLAFYQEKDPDPRAIARTYLQRATIAGHGGDWERAAAECSRATAVLDPDEDRRLYALARQNSVEYLLHGGSPERARQVFDELPPPYDRWMELRRLWIEGNLYRAEGELGAARVAYNSARKSYSDDGNHYYAALIALEEAALALDEGEPHDAFTMAQEASILLVRGAARQEALAVLRVLLTALEQGSADGALVLSVARRIAALKPSS